MYPGLKRLHVCDINVRQVFWRNDKRGVIVGAGIGSKVSLGMKYSLMLYNFASTLSDCSTLSVDSHHNLWNVDAFELLILSNGDFKVLHDAKQLFFQHVCIVDELQLGEDYILDEVVNSGHNVLLTPFSLPKVRMALHYSFAVQVVC